MSQTRPCPRGPTGLHAFHGHLACIFCGLLPTITDSQGQTWRVLDTSGNRTRPPAQRTYVRTDTEHSTRVVVATRECIR